MPFTEKVADVAAAVALPNDTAPGPLTFVHCSVTEGPGRPSSVTVPETETTLTGSVMVWSPPTSTVGG